MDQVDLTPLIPLIQVDLTPLIPLIQVDLTPLIPGSGALVETAANQSTGDIDLLDVDSATGNPPTPGIAKTPFHGIFLRVAVATHQLQCVTGDRVRRIHSALNYLTPEKFELQSASEAVN